MLNKNPFDTTREHPIRHSMDDLRERYFRLMKIHGATVWDTIDGKELESLLDREDLLFETDEYIFATPRTLTMYWNIIDHLDFGERHFLIIGEPGAGKEVIANLIGKHTNKEIISVNCATLVDSLAEALLFGVSGAAGLNNVPKQGTTGFVGQADGKVLFLDEFFDAQPSVLPKLLRLLQDPRAYHRIGEADERILAQDTIIVAASNRYPTLKSLRKAVQTNQLRADLVERFPSRIEVPPLRQRKRELIKIADNILKRINNKMKAGNRNFPSSLTNNSANMLRFHPYSWPGNVRELSYFLTNQARLHRPNEDGDKLDISHHAIDALMTDMADLVDDVRTTTIGASEAIELSAWSKTETVRLRERQLVARLYLNMTNEGRNQVDERWVSEQCKSVLQTGNPSQRLQDGIRQNCKQIAQKVNALYQLS